MPPKLLAIVLQSPCDWQGFRDSARALLQAQVPPGQAVWQWPSEPSSPSPQQSDLFTAGGSATQQLTAADLPRWLPHDTPRAPTPRLRPAQLQVCQNAALHADVRRFERLYRWLYRLAANPQLRDDALDADWHALADMARAVGRAIHKMRAFVRFRPITQPDGSLRHMAWFEPEHHILRANAPFFVRRFANMRWSILSPLACLHWDGGQLQIGPGTDIREAPPADAGEQLWLHYYATTFNPARLKTQAMLREMPRKYWRNLPEAQLIAPLVAQATQRHAHMLDSQESARQA